MGGSTGGTIADKIEHGVFKVVEYESIPSSAKIAFDLLGKAYRWRQTWVDEPLQEATSWIPKVLKMFPTQDVVFVVDAIRAEGKGKGKGKEEDGDKHDLNSFWETVNVFVWLVRTNKSLKDLGWTVVGCMDAECSGIGLALLNEVDYIVTGDSDPWYGAQGHLFRQKILQFRPDTDNLVALTSEAAFLRYHGCQSSLELRLLRGICGDGDFSGLGLKGIGFEGGKKIILLTREYLKKAVSWTQIGWCAFVRAYLQHVFHHVLEDVGSAWFEVYVGRLSRQLIYEEYAPVARLTGGFTTMRVRHRNALIQSWTVSHLWM